MVNLAHTHAFLVHTHTLSHTEAFTQKRFHRDFLHTDAFTHKPFYTKTLLHTVAFTHRLLYTQALLHTEAFFYTQTHLHTDAFTHRTFTQKLLRKDAFTHSRFYTQTPLNIQKLLHTDTLTHRRFYTQTLSHTEVFAHRSFYTQKLYTVAFNTQTRGKQFSASCTTLGRQVNVLLGLLANGLFGPNPGQELLGATFCDLRPFGPFLGHWKTAFFGQTATVCCKTRNWRAM